MRTQKRDRVGRAYHLGFRAGFRGRSADVCPFSVAQARGSWMGGWRDAQDSLRSGC